MNHEQIIKRFSLCIYLTDSPEVQGITLVQRVDRTLQTIMIYLVEVNPLATEEDWARYFLKSLRESLSKYRFLLKSQFKISFILAITIFLVFCQQLIFSYLQLICFYAARQVSDRFKQSPNLKLHYPLEECFIIACEAALKPAKLLRNFDFNSRYPLYGYARAALNRAIQNQVVREMKINSLKFSDYGLLKQFSPSQLAKASIDYGISTGEIIKYRLVWQSFQDLFAEFYPPTSSDGKRINYSLNDRQIEQIAMRYNHLIEHLEVQTIPVNSQEIRKMLTTCIQIARTFQNKQVISLEKNRERPDFSFDSFEGLIQAEKQEELTQLSKIIDQNFQALDKFAQTSILLWLGLQIEQEDLISFLKLQKQYQVSRQFQRYQKNILIAVIKHYDRNGSFKSTIEREINNLCNEQLRNIKEWLTTYSFDFFANILAKICQEDSSILVNKELIQQKFMEAIEEKLEIKLDRFKSAKENIAKFIDRWLKQTQLI